MKRGLKTALSILFVGMLCSGYFAVNPVNAETSDSINSWIDVKRDYGAAGDGTTDDRPAIQAAIDAVNSAGGGLVWLPQGNYLINTPLTMKSNVVLKGVGTGASRIICGTGTVNYAIYASGAELFAISDLTINPGNSTSTGIDGIYATGCSLFRMENLEIINARDNGINLAGTSANGNINNCYFYECGNTNASSNKNLAIAIEGTDSESPTTDINITNCTAKQCGYTPGGTTFGGGGFLAGQYTDYINFSNCRTISCHYNGFRLEGQRAKLTNCHVLDNGGTYGFVFRGPTAEGANLSVVDTVGTGIALSNKAAGTDTRYELTNIEVVNAATGIALYGAGNGGTAILRDANISNFTVKNVSGQGLTIYGGCEDVSMTNGQIYNCGGTTQAGLDISPTGGYYPNRIFVNNVISRNNYRGIRANNSGATEPYGILNVRTQGNTLNDSITGTWYWHSLVDRPNGSQN